MQYIQSYQNFSINEGVNFTNIINNFKSKFKNLIKVFKREKEETRQAFKVLVKIIKGKEVTKHELKLLKSQSLDIIKIISYFVIPSPIVALLMYFGKKRKFNLLPVSNDELIKLIEEENERMSN